MQTIEQCLERVIGISNRPCDCNDIDYNTAEVNESKSGLYIDDPFEGVQLFKLNNTLNCQDHLLNTMIEARRQAIGEFSIDLISLMSEYNKTIMTRWMGVMGDGNETTKYSATPEAVTGAWIQSKKDAPPASTLGLNGIAVNINETKTVTVELYDANDLTTALESWPINAIQGKEIALKFSTPIYLPLKDDLNRQKRYLFAYDIGTAKALETKFHCGCGVTPSWTKILDHGVYDESAILEPIAWTKGKAMRGLSLFGSVTCGNLWLCREWDFQIDGWARTMAKTIQYMTIFKIMQYIDNNNGLKFTLLEKREHLWGKMSHIKKEIQGRMNYLATEIPDQAWGCWECKPTQWKGDIIT